MSLPPGFLDELRTRTSLAQVVGRKVIWDMRKSNQGKGDMWAPCPFHQEKSASFHVDDRKGYYYCFGCHAKGDALSFVRETENVSFIEAVEILAREAAMPMPARDPVAAKQADRRSLLADVMEQAVKHYRLQLQTAAGKAARDYLAGRRLGEAAQARFEIGFAPDQRQGLFAALSAKGVAPELMVEAGLCAQPEDGGAPYDRFRGRIIYPIRNAQGRCIGLGGRAMDPNARAKYLNSPETPLFDKGRSLYNHGPAREAAGKGQVLIVAEGYMDVIALVEAGFGAAVAPLGTAITVDQLRLMWRIHPEPVIALDGDKAGIGAALRLIDLALPLLEAGKGLRFAILPQGQDPDDLIRAGGPEAMARVLDAAQPMVRLLWQRETEGKVFDSPERMAALRKALRTSITRINDRDIRRYYAEKLRFYEARDLAPPPVWQFGRPKKSPQLLARPETAASMLAQVGNERTVEAMRETTILAICMCLPDVIHVFEPSLEQLEFLEHRHQKLMLAILENYRSEADESLRLRVSDIVGRDVVERLMSSAHIVVLPAIKHPDATDVAISTMEEQLAKLSTDRALRREIEEAEEDIEGLVDEGLTWRLLKASEATTRANRVGFKNDDSMGEDRAALSRHLQSLIDGEVWVKKKR